MTPERMEKLLEELNKNLTELGGDLRRVGSQLRELNENAKGMKSAARQLKILNAILLQVKRTEGNIGLVKSLFTAFRSMM
jgi:DNA anti-recombination protein RmuC